MKMLAYFELDLSVHTSTGDAKIFDLYANFELDLIIAIDVITR